MHKLYHLDLDQLKPDYQIANNHTELNHLRNLHQNYMKLLDRLEFFVALRVASQAIQTRAHRGSTE